MLISFHVDRKTAIAIDTIINQKRFNDDQDESECHKSSSLLKSLSSLCLSVLCSDIIVLSTYREEAVLHLCGDWTEKEHCSSVGQEID